MQFDSAENADIAIGKCFLLCDISGSGEILIHSRIAKFSGYLYGGRPLGLTFVRYTTFGDSTMEGAEPMGVDHQMG